MPVHDAGRQPVPLLLDPQLVERHPRHEPRGLQHEDGADGDGAGRAERLQARQHLQVLFVHLQVHYTQYHL